MKDVRTRDYRIFLGEIKRRIVAARVSATRAINQDLIRLYWDIGCEITQRQEALGWGRSVVESLARDLKAEFPDAVGFSASNLWAMRRFFVEYAGSPILEQLVEESQTPRTLADSDRTSGSPRPAGTESIQRVLQLVPWGQHMILLDKVKAPSARLFYLVATARHGWSRRILLDQIKAGAYERSAPLRKLHNFANVLPEALAEQAKEALKSSYHLGFLGIGRAATERDLERKLIGRLREFILELGYGFCFIGQQYRLALGDKEYFVDLLFYHRFLKTLIAIELKLGAFEPEFAGKMDFYLNVLNEKERAADDNPSIGIILCAEKDEVAVEFSLRTKTNPIGVAEYELTGALPQEFKGKLPSERELRQALRYPICPSTRMPRERAAS